MILLKQDDGSFIINGVIDLSDCVYGPYLFELAISMCSYMMSGEDPINYIAPFLRGYLKIFPLSKASLGVLCYVILGRLAQLHINSTLSHSACIVGTFISLVVCALIMLSFGTPGSVLYELLC